MPRTSLIPFAEIGIQEANLSRFQQNCSNTFRTILEKPILEGYIIEDIVITPAARKDVPHVFGRPIIGYLIIKKSANVTIWDNELTNTNKSQIFQLSASNNVTVSVWVF